MSEALAPLFAELSMQQVLERFPGARRALFRQYHIGGCSSCGFRPEETLAEVCARNGLADVPAVLAHLHASRDQDEQLLLATTELDRLRKTATPPRVLDIRTREEYEAVRIPGAVLMSQDLMQEILGQWSRDDLFVICDHAGLQSLDAAAYFLGHGFKQVRCLRGGIDAWSVEVDPKLPRYRLE